MRPSTSLVLLLVIINQCIFAHPFMPEELPVPDISTRTALELRDTDPGPHSLTPETVTDSAFLMPIEDVFSIPGRGPVATGRIERGSIQVGDEVEIVGIHETVKATCTGVEVFRKVFNEGRTGENVGVLLGGIKREDIGRGQVLAKPGSIKAHVKFEAQVHVLLKEEGGRQTPFFKGYRPQFYFRTADITGTVELPEGIEIVPPGEDVFMTVTLMYPVAMGVGLNFAIREGGGAVGTGVVSKTLD